tara:strand:- start:1007 stop:3094 length:2088 start_codon:yes stop_codon:yes gene_type:complete
MDIKNILNNTKTFLFQRLSELIGILFVLFSILLFLSLVTYSPNDPNFIFSENIQINNKLGIYGSYVSDFFFQSIGLISFIIPFSIIMIGLNIFLYKNPIIIFSNFFFIILYSSFGALFFSVFNNENFFLIIYGNGGFVGQVFGNLVKEFVNINISFSYYLILILIFVFFLLSINFNLKFIIKFLSNYNKHKKMKNYDGLEINEVSNADNFSNNVNSKNRIQSNFDFERKTHQYENSTIRFKLPSIELLKKNLRNNKEKKDENISPESLEKILLDFGVEGKIKKVKKGPVVSLNEFEPAPGVKVSKIINLSEDIARNTSSESARIATIPGSNTIGIELPKSLREDVYLREIISYDDFKKKDIKLPIALGKNISGEPIVGDLSKMPHLLIAGTTGSGKSVCINTLILSLLFKHKPETCKFILIDPKMLELSTYEGVPHLLCPVITEPKKAASVLGWVVKEMESRYRLMTKVGVRNIDGYNQKHKVPMPYIVVIVDEMSDLMLVAGKEIENYIQKLSQMARAAGIHIIMATQRPSVDVITGTIKANFPTRISFQVTSKIDSRTILGEQGAEQLLGKGDMLFMSSANRIVRIHAPFVSEDEIEKVNNFLRDQSEPDYIDEILNFSENKENESIDEEKKDLDDLYDEALRIIKSERKASTSFLQRKLQIGYNRAARIIDQMEANGEVSKANRVGKREVLK